MNAAAKKRLRITGLGIVVAALVSTWAFGQKANPVTGGVPSAPTATASKATSAASADPTVERGRYLARAGDCISCHTGRSYFTLSALHPRPGRRRSLPLRQRLLVSRC